MSDYGHLAHADRQAAMRLGGRPYGQRELCAGAMRLDNENHERHIKLLGSVWLLS